MSKMTKITTGPSQLQKDEVTGGGHYKSQSRGRRSANSDGGSLSLAEDAKEGVWSTVHHNEATD